MNITKLKRETLSERAADELVMLIQQRGLQPGDSLPSQELLAVQFGVSRTVVREAVQVLMGRGLVDVINGKGAMIRPITSKTLNGYFKHSLNANDKAVIEMMEVRRALEVLAAGFAAERRSDQHVETLCGIAADMRKLLNDRAAYTELDLKLHLEIAAASQNITLLHMIESIRDATKDAIRTGLLNSSSARSRDMMQSNHEAIVKAIVDGDRARAQLLMESHMDRAVVNLRRVLEGVT